MICTCRRPPDPTAGSGPVRAWGLPDAAYRHRDGMITKAEVRAVALGKLRLPAAGVLWDVGAGSGSVAAEWPGSPPALRVFAVERRADAVDRPARATWPAPPRRSCQERRRRP